MVMVVMILGVYKLTHTPAHARAQLARQEIHQSDPTKLRDIRTTLYCCLTNIVENIKWQKFCNENSCVSLGKGWREGE